MNHKNFKLTILVCLFIITSISIISCNKADTIDPGETDFKTLEQTVITDFVNNIALGSYLKLSAAAANLNGSVETLNTESSDANLVNAQDAWKKMRHIWEQCESFLFGPVEDNDYDPQMDTWPTDYVQMDSLLASTNPLGIHDISNLTLSLRGFHPVEYIVFGENRNRKHNEIDSRQKKYVLSLANDLLNSCNALYLSWSSAPENFAEEVLSAGNGSNRYGSKREVFMAMAGGLIDICTEVGEEKMREPFETRDPAIVESPYSGNSVADFKNNITGIQNVYMGVNGGKGLKDMVAAKNKSLDNLLQTKITAAINSFDNITVDYEDAIVTQRVQIQQTMSALASLKETLENDFVPFIMTNVND